ncbi:hypothetical protein GGR53DRAFT_457736 [Hypoxylon sp. FL1150]|nr:hypothetical protein GGR53DRAFT_457736 [Hypoxylon sp. FL1150]
MLLIVFGGHATELGKDGGRNLSLHRTLRADDHVNQRHTKRSTFWWEGQQVRPWRRRSRDSDDALAFVGLPIEIHVLIFDHVEFIEDTICFGLANQYLWTLALSHVHNYYASLLGAWAGQSIVCVGGDIKPDNYPLPGLFSAEYIDELRPPRTNLHRKDDGVEIVYCGQPFTLSHLAEASVSETQDNVFLEGKGRRIYNRCVARCKTKDPAFSKARLWEIVRTESTYYPRDQPWILRNLTTKEFVRSEVVTIRPEYVRGPDITLLGFGEVVMARTCWSSTPWDVRINNTAGPPRGVWAGHRFDITTLANHESEADSAG